MEAMDVATLIRELLQAADLEAAAQQFLARLCRSPGIDQGYCYWREIGWDRLLPVAGHGGPDSTLPVISLGELDNPLVYGLMSNRPCHVERLSRLVDVGLDSMRCGSGLPVPRRCWSYPLPERAGMPRSASLQSSVAMPR